MEQALIQDIEAKKEVSLERALFIVSGLRADKEVRAYSDKLSYIHRKYVEKLKRTRPCAFVFTPDHLAGAGPLARAETLFDHLWDFNPKRLGASFLITDVIDAHLGLSESEGVGSCAGLTSLYTVLGLRDGLDLSVLASPDHMMTRLRAGSAALDIEHTDRLGFDTETPDGSFREEAPVFIVASVLNSRGMEKERAGDLEAAVEDYLLAARVSPGYANAHNNLGSASQKLGALEAAMAHYKRAIDLAPSFVEAYANLGELRVILGEHRKAIEDHTRAIVLDDTYARAYFGRAVAKTSLGDNRGAGEDFNAAASLNPEYLKLIP